MIKEDLKRALDVAIILAETLKRQYDDEIYVNDYIIEMDLCLTDEERREKARRRDNAAEDYRQIESDILKHLYEAQRTIDKW